MKELSIPITIIPLGNYSRDTYTFLADQFEFVPVPENSPAGILYNCNKDIVIELPSKEVLEEFATGIRSMVLLTDSKENQYTIGHRELPAIVTINPNLNSATLKIECKMLRSPYGR